jgi:hypothetical protein
MTTKDSETPKLRSMNAENHLEEYLVLIKKKKKKGFKLSSVIFPAVVL